MRSRKYDIQRALQLLQSFHEWRQRLKLLERNYHTDAKLRELIARGVVEPTGQQDRVGHYILVLRMAKADPKRFTPDDAIRNIYAALEYTYRRYPEAQSTGVAVLVDQREASLKNMDTAVPRVLFKALANHFPCRFGGLYAVDPPLFFRMLLPVAKLLLKRKLRERLHILRTVDELTEHFEPSELLADFGGTKAYDHSAYVEWVAAFQGNAPYSTVSDDNDDHDDQADNADESLAEENNSVASQAASDEAGPVDRNVSLDPTAVATVSLV